MQALASQSAPALDASYVDGEVLAHLRALALIDRLLAPSAHDPRIGDLLARVRNLVVQHAQAAIQAQSELEGPCASRPPSEARRPGPRPTTYPLAHIVQGFCGSAAARDRASARPTC